MLTTKRSLGAALAACALFAACSAEPGSEGVDEQPTEGRAAGEQAQVGGQQIPCDIAAIVEKNCALCHGEEPSFGAPMALTTLADFQAAAKSDASKKNHQVVQTRINATTGRMPPASSPAIPPADLAKLNAWLTGGAKGVASCTSTSTPGGNTTTPGGGGNKGGSGGASKTPIDYSDPNLKCYEFRAFTQGNKSQPYSVPTTPDLYVNFTTRAPWSGTQYIRSFRSLIDNKAVLHHWLFFRNMSPKPESVARSSGTHPTDEMMYGWAPGGDDMYMDPDVAMAVPGGSSFTLELHYNNRTGRNSPDRSGVEVCVTPTKPDKVAGLSWVGSDAIAGTQAVGTCRPNTNQTAHIIATQPHMHTKGRRMTVVQTKRNGQRTTVHDEPFDFNYQRMYLENIVVEPGDSLQTTCQYSAPATFGASTSAEMCYYFSIHWPAGALRSAGGIGSLIHGPNTCM